jgi:hypothetical protein
VLPGAAYWYLEGSTMTTLEGPDEQITLARAAELSGLSFETLRGGALLGRLKAGRQERAWYTTRRWLHRYLRHRGGSWRSGGHRHPLPPDYQAPEGEEPIR